MPTLFDKSRHCAQPPDERTNTEAPSAVGPARVHGPLVARGDGVQGSEPDTNTLGHKLLAAIEQVKATLAAPKEPVVVAPAPPTRGSPDTNTLGHKLLAAIEQVKATLAGPKEPVAVAPAPPTRSESDTNTLGHKLLAAIEQVKATQATPKEPVAVAPAPPTRDVPRASLFDVQAALAAVEYATTEDEVMAALKTFVDGAETVVKAASDPLAALTTIFGSECVATTTAACAAALVDLEAEAAATGGPITDRAAIRIARSMVHRVTRRADSTMAQALRARPVPRARTLRTPRAHRAHRRAVRLSAVASAGDGPPPPSPALLAASCTRDRAQLARFDNALLLVAPIDEVVERVRDLRERELTAAWRALVRCGERRRAHVFSASPHEARAVPREALARSRRAATRLTCSFDQVQR